MLMGGRGGRGTPGGSGDDDGPRLTRGTLGLGLLIVLGFWAFQSFYTVRPEEKSVELFLGVESGIGEPGLNFAPWPVVTYEVIPVTREQSEDMSVLLHEHGTAPLTQQVGEVNGVG